MVRLRSSSAWLLLVCVTACERQEPPHPGRATTPTDPAARGAPSAPASTTSPPALPPEKVEVVESAMGTRVHVIAYSGGAVSASATRVAIGKAIREIRRLEDLMTTWRPSELQTVNEKAGSWVDVSAATFDVMERSVWAGKISRGTFDITFASMGSLWKFGDAADERPKPPTAAEVASHRKRIDYRKIELDAAKSRVKIGTDQRVDVGGIAKGYAVDAAARVLQTAGVQSFLVQAGGDLYGAGKKPDGSPWVSGIRDPRGPETTFFATIELTDHAFSTAGDYARSYVFEKKRYHHIIDPRTGWPATACRSVTVWAGDAFTADAVDDAVFILGPKEGLELVESLDDVGAVIVDAENRVHISQRLAGKVKILHPPTDAL